MNVKLLLRDDSDNELLLVDRLEWTGWGSGIGVLGSGLWVCTASIFLSCVMKGRDLIGSDEPLRRPRVYYVTLETWSNSCWQCFTQSADICALLSLTALDSSGVKYYCICVSTWKRSTAVTGFLDCDRNLDICASVMTDFEGSGYLYWREPSEEAEKQHANWIFVANFHCHLTSGSLKCHLQQGLWPT
jgi:hypothetical protein